MGYGDLVLGDDGCCNSNLLFGEGITGNTVLGRWESLLVGLGVFVGEEEKSGLG
jgi:hypothetical protein